MIDPVTGNLPPGIHDATLDEVAVRYGATARRQALLAGLGAAVVALRAAGCGCLYLAACRREGARGCRRPLCPV